jgi:hypothetical protein
MNSNEFSVSGRFTMSPSESRTSARFETAGCRRTAAGWLSERLELGSRRNAGNEPQGSGKRNSRSIYLPEPTRRLALMTAEIAGLKKTSSRLKEAAERAESRLSQTLAGS